MLGYIQKDSTRYSTTFLGKFHVKKFAKGERSPKILVIPGLIFFLKSLLPNENSRLFVH